MNTDGHGPDADKSSTAPVDDEPLDKQRDDTAAGDSADTTRLDANSDEAGDGEIISASPSASTVRRRRAHVTLPSAPARGGPIKRRMVDLYRGIENRAQRSPRRYLRAGAYALAVAAHVVRQWARDRCHEKAASLAFQTMLSVVPLMAVTLAVLRGSGHIDAESSFVEFLAREFIPVSTEVIAAKLTSWSDNVNLQSLGLIGLGATVLVAFIMVNSIEKTINAIWRSERRRSLTQKFVVFYATATIGPFFMGTSLYQAGQFGWTEGFRGLVFSVLATFGGLFLANFFLPTVRVRIGPALLGALVSTLLFEIARTGFRVYVTEFAFSRFAGVYGPLSLVPIWLLWIYYSWLTFLLGIEVAHVAQNLHVMQRSDRRQTLSLENEILQRVNGVMGARVMMAISAAFMGGDKVMPRRALEDMFDLSDDVLGRITERLMRSDLIIAVEGERAGFMPARPPSEITLAEVLAAFRGQDLEHAKGTPQTELDRVLMAIEQDTRARTDVVHFDELVRRPARAP